ncbi:MAG TPA: MaoC family dehydratase [Solirubrobacterales bacterium]|nr:MaoC family dehydratase [Solirubrobacterales bacterium]
MASEPQTLPATPASIAELRALRGTALGPSGWHEVTQEVVDRFAQATGDHQWIHVDVERASASELGGTIAHGLLTLSLGPVMTAELLSYERFGRALNYGYDRVRFPAPVPVGARLRMRLEIAEVTELTGSGQVTMAQTFEREGGEKPVCVATAISRFVAG